jgi:hypothetical protein
MLMLVGVRCWRGVSVGGRKEGHTLYKKKSTKRRKRRQNKKKNGDGDGREGKYEVEGGEEGRKIKWVSIRNL